MTNQSQLNRANEMALFHREKVKASVDINDMRYHRAKAKYYEREASNARSRMSA